MSDNEHKDQDITEEDIRSWELPFVEESGEIDPDRTNAFNRKSTWKYEPPEPEVEVLPPTAEEISQIRESAYQEGFQQGQKEGLEQGLKEGQQQGFEQGKEEGLQKGYEEGLAQATEEIEQKNQIWQQLINHLHKPVEQVDQTLQQELILLAVSLARAVIRTEVQTNQQVIIEALGEGLKVLPIHESLYQIHLHPDDLALIKQHYSQEHIDKQNWVFVESPGMSRGGCDITTQSNAVDVSIERRVRDVLDKFLLEQGLNHSSADQ